MTKNKILLLLAILFACKNEKPDPAIVTLKTFFEAAASHNYQKAITYVDSAYREVFSAFVKGFDSNFVKKIQYANIDTVYNLYRIQTLYDNRKISYWWLKQSKSGYLVVMPKEEITKNWPTLERGNLKLFVSPNLTINDQNEFESLQNIIVDIKNYLKITSFKKINYFLCSSDDELINLTGLPKEYVSGHLGQTTFHGNIFTAMKIDTLEILTSLLKNENPDLSLFFPIGLYIAYCMKNKWNGFSTHCWVAAYHRDSVVIRSQDLTMNKDRIYSQIQPDISWIFAASFTDFVIHKYGSETLVRLVKDFSKNKNLDDLYRGLFKESPQKVDENWLNYAERASESYRNKFSIVKTVEHRNWTITYAVELEPFIDSVLYQLDTVKNILEKSFNTTLNNTLFIYILTSLSGEYLFPGWDTRGGISYDTIYIRSNILGDNFKREVDNISAETMHELTHYIISSGDPGQAESIPRWLNEGLTYYTTSTIYPFHSPIYELNRIPMIIRNKGEVHNIELFGKSWNPQDDVDPTLALQESFCFIKFLIEKYGWLKMGLFLQKLKESNFDINRASLSAYGVKINNLEKTWLKSVNK